jgi:hypothetical protein
MSAQVFNSMLGKTMVSVVGKAGGDEMIFTADDGKKFKFLHDQDCCESVDIVDIVGDLSDLEGSPIVEAEEVSNADDPSIPPTPEQQEYESQTWTFYRFSTVKGSVLVRWLGTSNGYYSEAVNFHET